MALVSPPMLGGCSMSFPMASMLPGDGDVTGSMAEVPFGRLLEEEDRRREKAALATALDPQHDGAQRTLQGTACTIAAGDWVVKTAKTLPKA